MDLDLQSNSIKNDFITLIPLKKDDFERLYQVASDPLIWEQHPNKNRYQKEVFESFFSFAIESKGAFIIIDTKTDEVIGSSRFYDYDKVNKTIVIGYTFLAKKYWGKSYNKILKSLMINHAFKYVDTIIFHIGAKNIRSQKSIEKIGAIKFSEQEFAYLGEQQNLNYFYRITKESWNS